MRADVRRPHDEDIRAMTLPAKRPLLSWLGQFLSRLAWPWRRLEVTTQTVAEAGDPGATARAEASSEPPAGRGTRTSHGASMVFDSYSHEVHNEDVGWADAALGIWVICDGVSNPGSMADGSPASTSRVAAQKVADALVEKLSRSAHENTDDLASVLRTLDSAFSSLHEFVEPGDGDATALALVHALTHQGGFWCYGYIGTGLIVRVNPARRIGGVAHAEILVSPHEDGDTIAISSRRQPFPASVGAVLARAGDLVLVCSDGMVTVWNALVAKKRAPAEVLLKEVEQRGVSGALDRFVVQSASSLRDDTTAYVIQLSR